MIQRNMCSCIVNLWLGKMSDVSHVHWPRGSMLNSMWLWATGHRKQSMLHQAIMVRCLEVNMRWLRCNGKIKICLARHFVHAYQWYQRYHVVMFMFNVHTWCYLMEIITGIATNHIYLSICYIQSTVEWIGINLKHTSNNCFVAMGFRHEIVARVLADSSIVDSHGISSIMDEMMVIVVVVDQSTIFQKSPIMSQTSKIRKISQNHGADSIAIENQKSQRNKTKMMQIPVRFNWLNQI